MKYFDESIADKLREAVEEILLQWQGVVSKKMFGCPCFKVKNKLFAFVVTDGVVITALKSEEVDNLKKKFKVDHFIAGKKEVKNWAKVKTDHKRIGELTGFLKKSYQNASAG